MPSYGIADCQHLPKRAMSFTLTARPTERPPQASCADSSGLAETGQIVDAAATNDTLQSSQLPQPLAPTAPPQTTNPGAETTAFNLPAPIKPRTFSCRCGRPVLVGTRQCLACGTPLGYGPASRELLPLRPAADGSARALRPTSGRWRRADSGHGAQRFWRCSSPDSAASCNGLVAEDEARQGVPAGRWMPPFRALFGAEPLDYKAALQRHRATVVRAPDDHAGGAVAGGVCRVQAWQRPF